MTLLHATPTAADTPPGGTNGPHAARALPSPTPSHAATVPANDPPCPPEQPVPEVLGYRLGGRPRATDPAPGGNSAPDARPPT